MEHGEEIQLAESGKIQVIHTYVLSSREKLPFLAVNMVGVEVQLVIGLLEGLFAS